MIAKTKYGSGADLRGKEHTMNYDFTNAIKTHMEENTQRIEISRIFDLDFLK